jgi:hypothetical protein
MSNRNWWTSLTEMVVIVMASSRLLTRPSLYLTTDHPRLIESEHSTIDINMRVFNRLLAVATDAGSAKPFQPAPMALLPPIPLYRRILRSHRRLNVEERVLGDKYIKAEFRAHKDIDNPVHIVR